jgi:transcription antitermination factor NusA-like protein
MTEEERRKRIQRILDKADEAMALMREARATNRRSVSGVQRVDTSIGTSIDGLRTVLDALASANYANQSEHINVVEGDDDVDRAIDLMREANHMAIALLNEL